MARLPAPFFPGAANVLAAPRDPVEKQQMGRFLGSPVLDQEFISGYLRFTDDTAGELLRQFQAANLAAQTDTSTADQWDSAVSHLKPQSHASQFSLTGFRPIPSPVFTPASRGGVATGLSIVVLDAQRDEPFLLGQFHKAGGKNLLRCLDLPSRSGLSRSSGGPFAPCTYSIETTISPSNSLDATAAVRLRSETGTERVLGLPTFPRPDGVENVTRRSRRISAFLSKTRA